MIPETLERKRQSLTQKETVGITFNLYEIDQMTEESIQTFLQADLKKIKQMVTYLQSINFKDDKIKDMAIRNLYGFATIKNYELRGMIENIKKEPQLSHIEEETLMTKIREMIETQGLIYFYYGFKTNLKTLICTRALSK